MPTSDFSKRNSGEFRRTFYRNKLIQYDPTQANDLSLLYGDNAESKYYELAVDGIGESFSFASVPAGVTDMKFLNPARNYYANTATFATFTIDRPTGAAGGYFILHSEMSIDACIQTIVRNTAGTTVEYWRILYFSNNTAGSWYQRTITAVAYSAT